MSNEYSGQVNILSGSINWIFIFLISYLLLSCDAVYQFIKLQHHSLSLGHRFHGDESFCAIRYPNKTI